MENTDRRNLLNLLNLMIDTFGKNDLLNAMIVEDALDLFDTCSRTACQDILSATPLYEHRNNPRKYKKNGCPVLSLTTIRGRLRNMYKFIHAIKRSSQQYHSINLYVSSEGYLLDEGIDPSDTILKNLYLQGVNIYLTSNTGPYRKIVPILFQLLQSDAPGDTIVVTLDDDVLYPDGFLEKLCGTIVKDECIHSYRGREIVYTDTEIKKYKEFSTPSRDASMKNLAIGRNGVAYLLKFFPKDPAYYIGHLICPTCDDIWLKMLSAINCVKTLIIEPEASFNPLFDFPSIDKSTQESLYHKFNKGDENDNCMKMAGFFSYCTRGYSLFDLIKEESHG